MDLNQNNLVGGARPNRSVSITRPTQNSSNGISHHLQSSSSVSALPLHSLETTKFSHSDPSAAASLLGQQKDSAKSLRRPLVLDSLLSRTEKHRIDDLVKETTKQGKKNTTNLTSRAFRANDAAPPNPQGEWQQVGSGDNVYWQREVPADDGGPPWTEFKNQDGQITRRRLVPDEQGGSPWTETVYPNGRHLKNRRYTDDEGRIWSETIEGDNRWRQNVNAEELAKQRGPNTSITVEGPDGPIEIPIHGAQPEHVEMIRKQLEALPPAMRVHVGEITVADDIGQILNPDGSVKNRVAGFGGSNGILIDSSQIDDPGRTRHVLYHEMGHVQDFQGDQNISNGPPWGNGHGVSDYGNSNAVEDYAEAHREVLEMAAARGDLSGTPDDLMGMSREQILSRFGQEHGQRYILILEQYGHEFPAHPVQTTPEQGSGTDQFPPILFPPGGGGFPPGGCFPPGGGGFPPGGCFPPGGGVFPPGGCFPPGGGMFPTGGCFPSGGGGFPPNRFPGASSQMQMMMFMQMQMMLMMQMLMMQQMGGFPHPSMNHGSMW